MKRARANDVMSTALVTSRDTHVPALPVRLQWRGIEVTPEFEVYAARVASGEQLAPYRGAVLARSTPEFPWASFQRPPERTERLEPPPFAARSLRHAAWLFGMAGAMLAAIGIGAGAFNATGDAGLVAIDSATSTLKPAHETSPVGGTVSDPSAASNDDDAWLALPGTPSESATQTRRAASGAPRRSRVAASVGDAASKAVAAAEGAAAGPTPATAPSGATTSSGAAAPAAGTVQSSRVHPSSEGIRTAALGAGAGSPLDGASGSTGGSALFSDQPSF